MPEHQPASVCLVLGHTILFCTHAGVPHIVSLECVCNRLHMLIPREDCCMTSAEIVTNLLQEVTRSWFSSLFCTALPAETAVRIWDVLFLEGPKILFRTALALFKVCALRLV